MDILDSLFERAQDPEDESDIPGEDTLLADYEAIRFMMVCSKWNGRPRDKATLSISHDGTEWVARMLDYDNSRSFGCTGKSIAEATESLSRTLLAGAAKWYYWSSSPTKGGNGKSATSSRKSGKPKRSPGKSE